MGKTTLLQWLADILSGKGERWAHEAYDVESDGRGIIINHTQLSYGQKRMLAFLYYVASSPSLVSVDELVNGLHHAATKLAEAEGVVVFHIDNDRSWSQRHTSENLTKLHDIIIARIPLLLIETYPEWGPEELEQCMTRLCPLVPFYSIEAWAYQNIEHAIRLCRDHYGGADVERFETWRDSRELIDELEQPKDTICLGSRHNHELAQTAYPHQSTYEAGTSFAAPPEPRHAPATCSTCTWCSADFPASRLG